MIAREVAVRLVVVFGVLLSFSFLLYERGSRCTYSYQSPRDHRLAVQIQDTPESAKKEACVGVHGEVDTAGRRRYESPKPPWGFMLALNYWEQQTQGVKSLLQMQCLASRMGLRVVEPFIHDSLLITSPRTITANSLHLSEMMNLDVWNKEAARRFGLLPITQWSVFLSDAPKDIIVVCMRYRTPQSPKAPEPGYNFRGGCPESCFRSMDTTLTTLGNHGNFRAIQKVCSNFVDYGGTVEEHSFIENILGPRGYRNVTVLLNEFRGFFGLYRTPVLSYCGLDFHSLNFTIDPSSKVMSDARKYIAGVFNDQPFIAVLGRLERVVLNLKRNLSECTLVLKSLLGNLTDQHNVGHRFLGMDAGRFGSKGTQRDITSDGKVVLKAVYSGALSLSDWESNFQKYASRKEAAYVANLQRAIASQAKCLVMFGGGGFQKQAQHMYERQHPNVSERCIDMLCYEHKGNAPIHLHVV